MSMPIEHRIIRTIRCGISYATSMAFTWWMRPILKHMAWVLSAGHGLIQQNILLTCLQWAPAHMDRIERLVERDKNHPSVIIWSWVTSVVTAKYFMMLTYG